MMVITFAEDFPQLNIEKCLKLALVHDIIEIYAGDTVVLDLEMVKTKEKREKDALIRLSKEFLETLPDFIELLEDYENKKSTESKFVYSLDKIQPIIQVIME
jgi:putative hydrolase of HD superfamily